MQEHEVMMESVPGEETPQGLRDEDLVAFVKEYPGLDSASIPQTVWDAVKGGGTLLEAYGRHERAQLREDNRRLKEEMDRMTRAAEDREKSLGSVRSSGRAKTMDPFLMGFYEE